MLSRPFFAPERCEEVILATSCAEYAAEKVRFIRHRLIQGNVIEIAKLFDGPENFS